MGRDAEITKNERDDEDVIHREGKLDEIAGDEFEGFFLAARGFERALATPVPFRNFVAQARLGVSREQHEAYFKQTLGDVQEPTLPFEMIRADLERGLAEVRKSMERELADVIRNRLRAQVLDAVDGLVAQI